MDYNISGSVYLKNCSALDFHTFNLLIFHLHSPEQCYILTTCT